MKLKKKGHKKIQGKKSMSTWVNLTNPSHTTWDMDGKKTRPPKMGQARKAYIS
jgi:hypothetical protein